MTKWSRYTARIATAAVQAGFTMIELLVVIAILGILATAVLSAINPIEQINRGRDTGTRSDAEQLIGAVERFNAFQGYYPWEGSASQPLAIAPMVHVDDTWYGDGDKNGTIESTCKALRRLSTGDTASTTCLSGTNELKLPFVSRLVSQTAPRGLFIYKETSTISTNVYVCFNPQSTAFLEEARVRCATTGAIPTDFPAAAACPVAVNAPDMICLP